MGGEADDGTGPQQPPGRPRGKIVLPEVDSVGARQQGDIGTVVHQHPDPTPGSSANPGAYPGHEGSARHPLAPKLNQSDPGGPERPENRARISVTEEARVHDGIDGACREESPGTPGPRPWVRPARAPISGDAR